MQKEFTYLDRWAADVKAEAMRPSSRTVMEANLWASKMGGKIGGMRDMRILWRWARVLGSSSGSAL
jgi:hypothetical protein